MSLWITFITLIHWASAVHSGTATTFGPNDAWNPDPGLACLHGRPVTDADVGVASWDLPCRARVVIYAPRTGRTVVARVLDRGPRRARRLGHRDDLDLTPGAARALRANGMERVVWAELAQKEEHGGQ